GPRVWCVAGRNMSGSSDPKSGASIMTLKRGYRVIVCALVLAVAGWARVASAAAIVGSMQEPFADYPAPTTFNNITPPSSAQNGGQGWNTTGTTAPNDLGESWGTTNNGGANRTVN